MFFALFGLHQHLDGLAVGGDGVLDFLSVCPDACFLTFLGFLDCDFVPCAAEESGGFELFDFGREAGFDSQSVIVRHYSQDGLAD